MTIEEQINEIKIAQARIETKVERLEGQGQETRKIVETVQKLALNMERMWVTVENLLTQIKQVKNDVEEIKFKPSKRWDIIIASIITSIISVAVGVLATKFFS